MNTNNLNKYVFVNLEDDETSKILLKQIILSLGQCRIPMTNFIEK